MSDEEFSRGGASATAGKLGKDNKKAVEKRWNRGKAVVGDVEVEWYLLCVNLLVSSSGGLHRAIFKNKKHFKYFWKFL
eukprot:gene1031-617_t